jgi:histidine ammonia-lyase
MNDTPDTPSVTLEGTGIRLAELVLVASRGAGIEVSNDAIETVSRAHGILVAARESGRVYGANTGVGANRGVDLSAGRAAHARRLLRSHASGVGAVENDAVTRAALVVRLEQLLAGGSGISAGVVLGLADAVRADALPTLHRTGSIGTADLTALGELALTLIGELPWRSGSIPPVEFADSDSLPFISSGAVTIAIAALAADRMRRLLDAATVVCGLSFLALRGSSEALDAEVHAARPHPWQEEEAARLRRLTDPVAGEREPAPRVQDPFGLRIAPQVHAPALASIDQLVEALEREIAGRTENPLVVDDGVRHHGQFHLASLAWTLDAARVAMPPVFTLSAGRVSLLMRPDLTGLPAFLAETGDGATSSGLMVTEYIAQDALARLRVEATPVSGGALSISLGLEEHASFATQSARLLDDLAGSAETVLAVELFTAVRALQLAPERAAGTRLQPVFERLVALIDPSTEDRPFGADIDRLRAELPTLGEVLAAE